MTASCCSKADKPTYARLPTNVVPQKYFIDYDVIDLMNFRFEATERIQLDVKEATHTIVCHAIELCVYDVSVAIDVPGAAEGEASKKLSCTQIQFIPDDETVTFHFGEELPVGVTITLSLRFHGFLNDKMHGFYRSEYEVDGEKRPLAVTQFEACDARRAFVCWDEPAIKARFEISMVTDASLTALSNMHVVETKVRTKKNAQYCKDSRKDSAEEKYWKFAETPVMSTYIVAMAVGEFDVLSGKSEEGVEVNVYTPPGKSERARFALDVGVRALSFFTKQFGIAYPLQKLDMVSIRGYPGAMENWGLVTYGETALLVDEKLTSRQLLVGVARVVCHELSHQWFGNLVTMDWWTGLWLNEGFAQYMEFDAVNALFPEWKMWEMFVEQVLVGSAFPSDALVTSHPIEVEVHHPKEVQEIFDAISYQKGASVVRMLADFLGRDVFYQGVHNYLVKYSYKNTKTEDLWDALEEASGVKITKMANSWTKQTGFPLVTVEMSPDNGLTIKQERFFSDFDQKADDATLWDVPLTLITSKDSTIQRIGIWDAHSTLAESTKVTPLTASADVNERVCAAMPECVQWFKLNPNQSNYYLVNYPSVVWKQLQEPIKTRSLSTVDRLSLVSSAFMLATSGVLSVSDAFDFTAAYADEPEYLCWKVISSYLSKYLTMFAEEPFYPQLQAYTRELFSPTMKRLTWDPTDEDKVNSNTANFRAETIARLGDAGDEATIAEAHVRFARYASGDKTAFSADLRVPVMCMHAKNSPKEDSRAVVEQLKDLFAASDMEEEKLGMLLSMGHVPDVEVKREVLEWAFKNEAFQIMEIIYVLSGVGSTPSGVQLVWDHITANYDTILGRFSPMMTGIFVGVAVGRFQRASDADMVEKFMATKDTSSFKRRLDTALESIRLKSKQFDRDSSVLANWLTQRQ